MGDRVHRWLASGALAIGLIGAIGWRVVANVNVDHVGATVSFQTNKLAALVPFASSPVDSSRITPIVAATVELPRDPFTVAVPTPVTVVADQRAVPRRVAVTAPEWRVSATLLAGTRRAAIINDELVYVGDEIAGSGGTLTAVERDHVVVTDQQGATHTVAVRESQN